MKEHRKKPQDKQPIINPTPSAPLKNEREEFKKHEGHKGNYNDRKNHHGGCGCS